MGFFDQTPFRNNETRRSSLALQHCINARLDPLESILFLQREIIGARVEKRKGDNRYKEGNNRYKERNGRKWG
jgi:hypothetical protein